MRVVAATVAAAVTAVGVVSCSPRTPGPVSAPASSQQAGPQPTADVSPAGDIPDNQAFIIYTASDHSFTLKVPEGWAKTDVAEGVAFTDKFNAITVTSRPTVMAPTVDSVRRDLPDISKATPGYQPGDVTQVNRVGGQAILITYGADSPPNPVTGKVVKQSVERYEFYRSGHQVTVTLAAPVGADNVDPWRIVTDSFTWMP
ncbi:MAG: hypothetical protein M3O32_02965 [Actinomycetota bacterium]|nr:hypothetical protein [Actinomycetota bacterium]